MDQLQRGIDALRQSTWDDLELASRFAAVLDNHIDQYKQRFVIQASREEATVVESTSNAVLHQGISNHEGDYGLSDVQSFQDAQSWLSMPLDILMAPFGVATDEAAEPVGLEDGDWSILWNLPPFPG